MSLPRYQEYRDSGERWLGTVPAHWDVHRLKNLFEIRKRIVGEEGHQVLSITQNGIKIRDIESNDGQLSMDYSKYQVVNPGDFAMNHMDLLTGFVDISMHAGVTSPDYRVFAIRDGILCEPKYFLYLLQNGYRQKIFYAFGQGASEFGRWRFPTDQFNDFRFPCPPHEEQIAIATFLDREISKIDALIGEQEKLIALLAEKRQATISRAVTKGLNANAPVKDSGVAWLGEVPAHWEIRRIKNVSLKISKGTTPTTIGRDFVDDGIRFLKAENIVDGRVNREPLNYIDEETHSLLGRSNLAAGDVLVVIAGATTGKSAVLREEFLPCNTNQAIAFVRPIDRSFSNSIQSWLSTVNVQERIKLTSVQSAQPNLSMEDLGNLYIPLAPCKEERAAIAAFLTAETTKLDTLRSEVERTIGLLQERRSALIAAAVTGQIDVRSAVPQSSAESLEAIAA